MVHVLLLTSTVLCQWSSLDLLSSAGSHTCENNEEKHTPNCSHLKPHVDAGHGFVPGSGHDTRKPSMHEVNSHWAIGITSTARREAKSADVSSRSIARTYRSADGPIRQSAAGCGSARRATWHSGCGRRASSVHTSEKVSSGFSTHTLP